MKENIEKNKSTVLDKIDELLDEIALSIPALAMGIIVNGNVEYLGYRGKIAENTREIDATCRFDVASLTKIFSGIAFMKMVEEGIFSLNEPICHCFPEMDKRCPIERDGVTVGMVDAGSVTWFHALTHTTGIGWTREKSRPSLPNVGRSLMDIFNLPYACAIGEQIIYSDIPIILMGKAMEMKTGKTLDEIVQEYIISPLGLLSTGYNRGNGLWGRENIVPTELDDVFRKDRCWGYVHDENTFLMDGVAAHAGIFSTVEDLCVVGNAVLCNLENDGLLKKDTMNLMIEEHACDGEDRRGLMWQLSNSKNPAAYTGVLSSRAFGHAGFTGCFMWMDPETKSVVVFLSNDVYRGRENRVLFDYRQRIMQYVKNLF